MTPQIVALQSPLSMGFSRQEHWSGLPFLSPEDLPDPGIKPRSPALQADSLLSEPPGELSIYVYTHIYIYIYMNENVKIRMSIVLCQGVGII